MGWAGGKKGGWEVMISWGDGVSGRGESFAGKAHGVGVSRRIEP